MYWVAAGLLEALFWIGLGVALIARYWWRRQRLARWALIWLAVDTAGYLVLAVLDFLRNGQVSTFQVVAVVAAGYALTAGRREVRKFDHRARLLIGSYRASQPGGGSVVGLVTFAVRQRVAARTSTTEVGACTDPGSGPGSESAHGSASAVGRRGRPPDTGHARRQRIWWYRHLAVFLPGQVVLWSVILSQGGPDHAHTVFTVARIWITVFVVDAVWSLSYSIWPRRVRGGTAGSGQDAGVAGGPGDGRR